MRDGSGFRFKRTSGWLDTVSLPDGGESELAYFKVFDIKPGDSRDTWWRVEDAATGIALTNTEYPTRALAAEAVTRDVLRCLYDYMKQPKYKEIAKKLRLHMASERRL